MVIALILKITELFLSIAAGFALVRSGLLRSEDSRVLSVLTLYLLLPCTLFSAFQIDFTAQVRQGLILSVILSLLIHLLLMAVNIVLKKAFRFDALEQVAVMYPNSANLIVPIVNSLYGPSFVIYTSGYCMVQIVLLWSHARSVISGQKQITVKKIIGNPCVIAVILGLVSLLVPISLPAVIVNTASSIGAMVGPTSMLVAGMLIADLKINDLLQFKRLPLVLFWRLTGIGLIILAVLHVIEKSLNLPGMEMVYTIVFLATIAPTASTVTQFCQLYDKDAGYANAICLAGTLLCIVTMPLMVGLYLL